MSLTGLGWFLVVLIAAVIGTFEAIRQDWKIASYWSEKRKAGRK